MKSFPVAVAAIAAALFAFSEEAVAKLPLCTLAQIRQSAADASIPAGYMNPELMAIGDSLFNGVESLSISREKAYYSVPGFVARGLGIQGYRGALYDRPLLADLDVDLKSSWSNVAETLGDNIDADIDSYTNPSRVQYFRRTKPKFFDDIAVAQADSAELMCDTSGQASAWISRYYQGNVLHIPTGKYQIPLGLNRWFYETNSRFLLNPSLDDRYKNLSQLAEVIARGPKKLLVNIGANDGVWLMAFKGFTPDTCYETSNYSAVPCTPSSARISGDMAQLVRNMWVIAQALLPLRTHVFVNLLGAPRALANLNPVGLKRLSIDDRYFDTYETYINDTEIRSVSGGEVKAMDSIVARTNGQIIYNMCRILGPQRVTFVDIYGLLTKFDAKNAKNSKPTPQNSVSVNIDLGEGPVPVLLDNLVLHPDPKRYSVTGGEFSLIEGGLFSLDNMHPTAFGYGLVANRDMAAITAPAPHGNNCAVVSNEYQGSGAVDFPALYTELVKSKSPSAVFAVPHTHLLLEIARSYLPKATPSSPASAAEQAEALKSAKPGDEAGFREVRKALSIGTAPQPEPQN